MVLMSIAVVGVSVLLAGTPQGPPPGQQRPSQSTADAKAEAEQLARSGAYRDALRRFQAIAAANPDDAEARLWIARLHALTGNPGRAVDVYEALLATHPDHVDALLGLGDALTTLGRYREAGDALNRAEKLAPDNPVVLAAQGRLHGIMGRGTLATAYYDRALVLQPDNETIRRASLDLRARQAHRVEGTYYFEKWEDVPNTNAVLVEVNARLNDTFRGFVGLHQQRKFDLDETRAGGGVEWMPRGNMRARVSGMFGFDTDILPATDTAGEFEYYRRRVAWLGSVRYLGFDDLNNWVISPGVHVYPSDRFNFGIRYYRGQTSVAESPDADGDHAFSARAALRLEPRLWVSAGYASGWASLGIITVEQIGQDSIDTLSFGARFDPRPMTSVSATFENQWRDNGVDVATLFLSVIQRF